MKRLIPRLAWYEPFEPFSYAFIRCCLGIILAAHGVNRVFFGGSAAELGIHAGPTSTMLIGLFEIIGGVAIALGFLTRPFALLFALLWFVIAINIPVPLGKSWLMVSATLHYPAMVAAICIAFVLSGGGRYSVDRSLRKEF